MKEWAKEFYKSQAWQNCRRSYIAQRNAVDGGLCEACQMNPGYIVHHVHALTPQNINDPAASLSYDNLAYVCKQCHDKEHGHCGQEVRRIRCRFDQMGNPIPKG